MELVTITNIEKSQFNSYSKVVYFEINGVIKHSIVTPKVFKVLKIKDLYKGDKIHVLKSFGRDNEVIYFIKKYEREINNK